MSNFVLIMVLVIFAACFYVGSRKGLVRTVFSLFSSIVVLLAGTVISPVLSNQLRNNEKIFNAISTKIEKSLENYQKNNANPVNNKGKQDNSKIKKNDINKISENEFYLPANFLGGNKVVKEIISDILKNEYFTKAKEEIQKEVNHRVAIYLTGIVINSVTFILVYFLLSVGLYILSKVLNIISKLPVLNELNRIGGGIAGLVKGLVIVWLIFTLMTVFIDKPFIQEGMRQINSNMFLKLIYKYNVITRVIGLK